MGKVGQLAIIVLVAFVATLMTSENYAFAGTTEWQSEILVGILEPDSDSNLVLEITTYSNDGLKIEWNSPYVPPDKTLVGYEILRKTLNSDYVILVSNTNSLETSFVDKELQSGYYGYMVNPIIKPYDVFPSHGIDRLHPLFSQYVKYQELIAVGTMMQLYPDYFDPPFEEINNVFRYEFTDTP